MHKITAKEFDISDFSTDHLIWVYHMTETIRELNHLRYLYLNFDKEVENEEFKNLYTKKDIWWQIIQLLPSSYNQTRNVMMNYEVLANIYKSRKDHKLDEWREFCKWIETDIPYNELIFEACNKPAVVFAKNADDIYKKEFDKLMKEGPEQ